MIGALSTRTPRNRFAARCAAILLVAASLGAPSLLAQDDPSRMVQTQQDESRRLAPLWLASEDPRTRAWGAFLAARDEQATLLPRLQEALHQAMTRPALMRGDEREATRAVIDAIVRLNGTVAHDDAAAMYAEFPAASLILLSRAQDTSDVLLRIFREEMQIGGWLSAGNLLTERRTPGFAATALDGLTIGVAVRVIDPDGTPARPGGVAGSCLGGLPSENQPGWPQIGNYYVASGYAGVRTLLSRGVSPTFYIRMVGPPAPVGYGPDLEHCGSPPGVRDAARARFVAQLAGEWPQTTVTSAVARTLTWTTEAQYLHDLRSVLARQRTAVATLTTKLVKAGAMTPDEQRVTQPSIVVTISDARRVRQRALPTLSGVGERVRFESTLSTMF